ncbi:hypothetical protein KL86PLE_30074 [uncultured Pleomorphomonas sp.]|uniref:Uncharacterized protein n=1 Tax=uncultured Pleomorphomonas sp. TaxID=442121 RepID=A0A212LDR1_9HYPH|nr:hypothetical protein KL86PLE_30074 [uncultured Pleomorphomonas sp.]
MPDLWSEARGCVAHYALDETGKVDYSEATFKPVLRVSHDRRTCGGAALPAHR